MNLIDKNKMKRIILCCMCYNNYKAAVVVPKDSRNYWFDYAVNITPYGFIVKRLIDRLEFLNGSSIKFLPPIEDIRGHRAHCILYDDVIDEELKNQILLPMEIPYKSKT